MLKKIWWLIALAMMLLFGAVYAEEAEPVFFDPAMIPKVAQKTSEPILSGALHPMVGETYTYTLVNAGKAANISIKIYACTLTSDGAYQYYPNDYTSRTLSSTGTFKYKFTELRPYLIIADYTKSGQSKSISFFIDPVNKTAALAKKINKIVQACKNSGAATQYDIALWLHDYLVNHAYYDLTYTEYGPDGVLLKGYGVCDSYSRAYQMLLNAFGIPNHRQDGTAGGGDHAWNVVKLDGKWYSIDVTWDDPAGAKKAVSGQEHHEYFAIPDTIMGSNHTYKITYPCTATDGSYYVRFGLPEYAAVFIEHAITACEIGQQTISVDADGYSYKSVKNESGADLYYTSSLQNEIVFPLMAERLSEEWWAGEDEISAYQYSFAYDASSHQLVGTLKDTSVYTAEFRWTSFPLLPNQMTVSYKFNKPINKTQGMWLWFTTSASGSSSYSSSSQSVRVTAQEGTAAVEWDRLEPFDLSVSLANRNLAKLHGIPLSPDDGQLLLPKGLQTIGEEAFCKTAARFVSIPDGCRVIDRRAFADANLACVVIPASVEQIDDTAFPASSAGDLWLIVEEGSKADRWADGRFPHMSFEGKVLE